MPIRPASLLSVTLLLLVPGVVRAMSDGPREGCTYNGIWFDHAARSDDRERTSKIPDDFTGLVVCTDRETKRVYETFHLVGGKRQGEYRHFDRQTGLLDEITPYKDDLRHGCVTKLDGRTGKRTMEFCLRNGKPEGLSKFYDRETGALQRVVHVSEGPKTGPASEVQLNKKGQPTSLTCGAQTLLGEDDLWCGRGGKTGEVTLYSDEGWPREKLTYRDGKRHGLALHYHRDGHLMRQERYEDDKRVETKRFEADGKTPTFESQTRAGKETAVVYFEDSKKPRLVVERSGPEIVKELQYYANGELKLERLKVGPGLYHVRHTSEEGVVTEGNYHPSRWGSEAFWAMEPEGLVKTTDGRGRLLEEARFKAGERDGLQRTFDPDLAKVLRREHFEKGRLRWSEDVRLEQRQVLRREYAEDGSLTSERTTAPPQTL